MSESKKGDGVVWKKQKAAAAAAAAASEDAAARTITCICPVETFPALGTQ
jgi:predicted kinase